MTRSSTERRLDKKNRKYSQNHRFAMDRSKGWARYKCLNRQPRFFKRSLRAASLRLAQEQIDLAASSFEVALEAVDAYDILHGDHYERKFSWYWEDDYPIPAAPPTIEPAFP